MSLSPFVYDLTHLSQRAEVEAPSGIDRVDLMFARAFAANPRLAGAIHYGVRRPSVLAPGELAAVVARAERRWSGPAGADPAFARLKRWLAGGEPEPAPTPPPAASSPAASWRREIARRARIGRYKWISNGDAPAGAVYLNIAQHALERRSHFAWLNARPDVKPVFFLHDLLPLDYPEFWPDGHEAAFTRRLDTMFSHARGLVVSSEAVAARARAEIARRGLDAPPIFARALPSPLGPTPDAASDPELSRSVYVLSIGTIEPRKNHLMLLNLWRAMIEAGESPPKLVLVGGRGWLNAETSAVLDRSRALKSFVTEAPGLADSSLRTLLRHARALLVPSFAEGYGLPVVEALELGVPVVASDLPVFLEISKGCAELIATTDGAAWRRAVTGSANAETARKRAAAYPRNDAADYFDALNSFLRDI